MIPILRICDSCRFYREDSGVCPAFPNGVPLSSTETHFDPLPKQRGEFVYELDPAKQDLFQMYSRVHPEVRFPITLTYNLPEPEEDPAQADTPVDKNGNPVDGNA